MSEADTRHQSRRAVRQRNRVQRVQRRRKIQALAAGGLVLGVGASATVAAWTDEEFASGTFQAGQFNIEANVDGTWQGSNTMQFDASNMFPGATAYAPVFVSTTPDTTVAGVVTVAASGGEGALAQHLQYRAVATELPSRGTSFTCDASNFTDGADYVFGSGSGYVDLASAPTSEAAHPVAAGGNDAVAYCFEVQLAQDAPNDAQGTSADHTWTFNARSQTEGSG